MPKSCAEKDDHPVDCGSALALAVAAQRNIKVLLEPGGKRNMPLAPKVLDTCRTVGIIKVLLKLKAEHKTKSDSHIGIARKIKVYL